ncbi:MAG: NAD(P)-dependent glycerol-3-phosphate dehydrogenase [Actinobacteria bacterium]|nr:NAD(P)-dependent glycerol-3-phosphate dehydrogenase [Actinomycetota bacterium]MCL5882678.1 NAD(P)-dependent glycerol-3-phosphate dehydrogenase [Actinomycetota bacterium]
MRASVVGGGSWGTAFARLLAGAGIDTELICRRAEQAAAINESHRNPDYLSDVELPAALAAATFEQNRLGEAELAVIAVPSRAYREAARAVGAVINPEAAVLSLTKGLEPGTLKRLSEVLTEELPQPARSRVMVLSGPNHAEEVACDIPTATTIASADLELAAWVQHQISTESFRVYINPDLMGVELCAAAKNVIALAAGMSDGLGFGDNTKASLITRGLAEMARLGERLGADAATFSGLAGMGDLIATCTSRHSRNRRAGELIAAGRTPEEAEAEMGMIAEGLTSARSVRELAGANGVEMPITEQVCAVIYEGKEVRLAVTELMTRTPRPE